VINGQPETELIQRHRKEIEGRLRALVQHNHTVTLVYDPEKGSFDEASCDHGCKTPRFRHIQVKIEPAVVPNPSSHDEIAQPPV
jgi:hypothetical protein